MPTYTRPTSLSIDNTEAVTGGESGYKPRKISAMSTLSVQVGYPLKSALKNSTGNLNQENSGPIPTVVTSPPPTELRPSGLETRRGSHLGRSKSVKINRVKFGENSESGDQGKATTLASSISKYFAQEDTFCCLILIIHFMIINYLSCCVLQVDPSDVDL